MLISFAISNHTDLKLYLGALRSYLRLICKYELYILPNKKGYCRKGCGENYIIIYLEYADKRGSDFCVVFKSMSFCELELEKKC